MKKLILTICLIGALVVGASGCKKEESVREDTAATAQIPLQTKILSAAHPTTDEATQKRIEELIKQLGSISNYVRSAAFKDLVKIGQPAVQPLSKALRDENVRVRSSAASALGEIGDSRAVLPLKNLLEDEFICIREAAANALEQINRKVAPEEC